MIFADQSGPLSLRRDRKMFQTHDPEGVSRGADLRQLLPGDVDLASVDKLYDVRHGVSLQFQTKVLQPQYNWNLDILFTQLIFEKFTAGGHHYFMNIYVVVLRENRI